MIDDDLKQKWRWKTTYSLYTESHYIKTLLLYMAGDTSYCITLAVVSTEVAGHPSLSCRLPLCCHLLCW